ncbi:MAG: hypothetical protein ABI430_03100 [Candidatus Taylorbacteria bacterium]
MKPTPCLTMSDFYKKLETLVDSGWKARFRNGHILLWSPRAKVARFDPLTAWFKLETGKRVSLARVRAQALDYGLSKPIINRILGATDRTSYFATRMKMARTLRIIGDSKAYIPNSLDISTAPLCD